MIISINEVVKHKMRNHKTITIHYISITVFFQNESEIKFYCNFMFKIIQYEEETADY